VKELSPEEIETIERLKKKSLERYSKRMKPILKAKFIVWLYKKGYLKELPHEYRGLL